MKRFLLSVALLLACSGVAFAQESEFSGGGGGGITTAGGSGTAGVIPAFVSASSLEDSKMTTSGTNSGAWTLYDSTAVTGATALVIKPGAGQSTTIPFSVYALAGDPTRLDIEWGVPNSYGGMTIHSHNGTSDYPLWLVATSMTFYIGASDALEIGRTGTGLLWSVNTASAWAPGATNTYDIGTSSAVVREIFGRSLTSDSNLVLGAGNADQIVMGSTYFGTTGSAVNTLNLGYAGAEFASAYVTTSIQGTRTKTLTDNTITDVVQISSATTDRVTAGRVSYTVYASDATNHLVQTETGEVPFLLVNENGTVTVTLGTVYGTAIDSAGGAALTNTFASSVSGTDAKIRVTSNYDQATLTGTVTHTIEYRVYIDSGTATVTPQ